MRVDGSLLDREFSTLTPSQEAFMDDFESVSHARWEGKYHVVWIPTYRPRPCTGSSANTSGRCCGSWRGMRECVVEGGHLNLDHVHMLLSIPPKHAVAQVLGFRKGKSVIHLARTYLGQRRNVTGQHVGARGYYVSTVGRDEATIREYIQKQEVEEQRLDQLEIFAR